MAWLKLWLKPFIVGFKHILVTGKQIHILKTTPFLKDAGGGNVVYMHHHSRRSTPDTVKLRLPTSRESPIWISNNRTSLGLIQTFPGAGPCWTCSREPSEAPWMSRSPRRGYSLLTAFMDTN